MTHYTAKKHTRFAYRLLSAFIAFTFSFTTIVPSGYAQTGTGPGLSLLSLPAPGTMVTPSAAFVPVLLKGMTIHPENPLQFDFIIDSGNTDFKEDQIKGESKRLVKYFLASMTIPKDDLWVNLSPYESDKIIPDELGKTELGRDMLAQDYILKQLTASLMYPEKELGKEFWSKVYKLAQEKYGTTEIPVNTFNKVWILPETATVYEHGQTVYIVDAKLKVMLDSDYEAQKQDASPKSGIQNTASGIETSIIKEIILPEIEKEVNYGQNFAPLRQIYHSLILAKWYKETIKESLLSKIYVDQKKIAGVNLDDATLKDQIYAQYMEAYKKGVFNYIKEDYDQLSNQPIPRKYFSGGFKGDVEIDRTNSRSGIEGSAVGENYQLAMEVSPQKDGVAIPKKNSSPITPQEAQAMIKGKLAPEQHHLINDTHVQLAMAYEGDFHVVYHAGPPEGIEIIRGKKFGQSSSPVEKTANAPLSDPAIKNIIKKLKIIRKSFADEKYLEQENLVHEALEELLGYIDNGVEIDSPVLNLYFLTKIMLKPLKASPGLFRNGGTKEPTQIFLVDEANQEVLVSQRGLYKRLFARKWAPSVNTEKTDNDGIRSAIEQEAGIAIDPDRLQIMPQRFKTQMISYDLYALDTAENRALKKAAQKMSNFSDPVHGIAVEYDEKRMAVIVYSVNDQVNQDAVREVAEQVQRLSKIPYMYPVYEQNHSRFAIYLLTQEEKARIQERIAHNSDRKGITQKNIVSGQYSDKTRLQSDLIDWDSDDMVFRPIEDIVEEYRKTPSHFTLDLIVPYLEDLSVWRSILPKGQYVIPVNSPWLSDLFLSGGKGGNLKRLQQLADSIKGLHIPRTAAISIPAFEEIVLRNPEIVNLINQLDAVDNEVENKAIAREIRERIVSIVLPEAFKDQVRKIFEGLGGDIAVRSSANAEDIKDFSASGLGESFLHITSVEDVHEKIKEVWASLYADGFIQERRNRGIKNVNAKMAVVLQEFIDAVAAGVVNSYDDASFRAAYKIISNWGLGESVVQGKGLHDKWIVGVNPADKYDILEEEIAPKTKITLAKDLSGIESLEINPDKDYVHPVLGDLRSKSVLPSLSDEDIIFIAQNAQGIHRYYQRHGWAKQVDIEFAKNAAGQIYIVQTRPLNVNTADFHKITVEVVDTAKVPEGTVQFDLSEGTTAQIGIITAKLLVTANIPTVQEANNVIVVTSNTNNAWNHVFSKFKGVITQQGREVAHATNNSRENKIPCMVGVPTAMEMLKDYSGEEVTFDAYGGKIYLGRMPTKEIEIETTFWVNELDKLQEVLADLKPHELRRPFSESMKAWSAVFHKYYDGNFRRRSAIYEPFQLDYYYAAWDRLTEYLNERYEGRRPFKLRTQKRIIRDSGLFNRIVEEDQSTIFHFIKGIKDLSIDDLWDLYNDRLEGLNRFREYFHNLQTVDENNVDEVMDQLIEGFKWMHFAYWLGAAIYELYATKQTVYIDGLFQPVAQNGALSVLDEKFLTNISRERDMEIQIIIEKIRRDEKLVNAQNAENAQDLANLIQKTRPELHEKIKGLSDQYRRNSEDIRVIDETLEYYKTLLNGLLSADAEAELFTMAMKNKMRKYKFGKAADLNEIKEKHMDFYYLLSAYARRVIAGERAGENANHKVWVLNNTPAVEIEQSIKRAFDELFQAAKDEMGEEEKYFNLIKSYPRLIKTLQLDKIERTLREDGHHIAVQAQRPLAKALLNAAKRTAFFTDPEEIFKYSTAEVAAILKEDNPEYIKRSLEWRKIMHEADLNLLHVWEKLSKDGTMAKEMFFILNIPYHKFLMKMYSAINIINEQIGQARSEQLHEWYLSEKNRLMERIADVKFIIDSHVFSPNGGHLQQYKENSARKIEESEALIKKILDSNDPSAFFDHFQQGVEANRKQEGKELLVYFPINENPVLSSLIGEITHIVRDMVTSPEEESASKNTYVSVDNSYISLAIYERAAETLRLDFKRIANLVSKNADTMGPFVVKLIGPRLMPDGFVILEYEVISPEINALRDLTKKDILAEENRAITEAAEGIFAERIKGRLSQLSKEEKTKIQEEAFEEAKGAFKSFGSVIPNIYHSTIAILKDRSVTQEMLINLERQFKNIRDDIKFQQPQLFLIDSLALSEIDVKTRQFGKVFKTSLAIEDAGDKTRSSSPITPLEAQDIAQIKSRLEEIERRIGSLRMEEIEEKVGRILDAVRTGKVILRDKQVNILKNAGKSAEVVGQMDRSIAEDFGYVHQTVNAIVLTPGMEKIVLIRRAPHTTPYPLHLTIPGGHPLSGETDEEGITARLKAELGLSSLEGKLREVRTYAYGFDEKTEKDKTKERRKIFIYQLTPQEHESIQEHNRLYRSLAREGEENLLQVIEGERRAGRGDVWSYHEVEFEEIEAAAKGIDEESRYENKQTRFIEVEDIVSGEKIMQPLTPDLLDHLLDNANLVSRIKYDIDRMKRGEEAAAYKKVSLYKRLVFLGPVASGKSTQAGPVAAELGVPHISVGELLRDILKFAEGEHLVTEDKREYLGKIVGQLEEKDIALIQERMQKGQLIENALTDKVVQIRLSHEDVQNGFVFDGYPREESSAKALEDFLARRSLGIDRYVHINVSEPVSRRRLDAGNHDRSGRSDDKDKEAREERLRVFNEETMPVLASRQDRVIEIDGDQPQDYVADEIMDALFVSSSSSSPIEEKHHLSDAELGLLREANEEKGFISERGFDENRVRKQLAQISPNMEEEKITEIINWARLGKNFKGEEVHILDGVGKDDKVIGRIDRNIAEEFGLIHETANAVVLTPNLQRVVLSRRAHNKTFGLNMTIYGGHLGVGQWHKEGVIKELKEELGLSDLRGKLDLIGYDAYDRSRDKISNRERRSLFVYVLEEDEYKVVLERKEMLEEAKSQRTEGQFKIWIEEQQEMGGGKGEVWSVHEKSLDELIQAPQQNYEGSPLFENEPVRFIETTDRFIDGEITRIALFTPDLLNPMLDNDILTQEIKNRMAGGPDGQSSSPANDDEVAPERRNELADQVLNLARRKPQVLEASRDRTEPDANTVLAFIAEYHLANGEKRFNLTLYDYPAQGGRYEDEGKTRAYLQPIEWDGGKRTLVLLLPGNLVLTGQNPLAILYQIEKHIRRIDLGTRIDLYSTSSPVVESRQPSDVRRQSSIIDHQLFDGEENLTTEDGQLTTDPGGIDMNAIDLDRRGAGVEIQFDPAQLQDIIDAGIDGFAPVIINITPLPSVLPLLGLDPAIKEESLELSSSG